MGESLIVRRGGSGGLKATDAILRVIAPAGSTVTISQGGVSKSDLGHENADDNTLYDYYFIIHQSQFDSVNPWTVTATRGSETASDTVIIDSADEYDVLLAYEPFIWEEGNEHTEITGGWVNEGKPYAQTGSSYMNPLTISSITGGIKMSQSSINKGGIYRTTNAIDLTLYSSIYFTGDFRGASSNVCGFYVVSDLGTKITENALASINYSSNTTVHSYDNQALVDISSIHQSCYLYFAIYSSDSKYINLKSLQLKR